MRKNVVLIPVLLVAAAGMIGAAQRGDASATDSPDVALKMAINAELVTGDVNTAIARYSQIADRYRTTAPAVAARALVQMAASYEKLGKPEARHAYEEVLRLFPDEEAASRARARLGNDTGATATKSGVTLASLPNSDGLPGTVTLDGKYLSFTSWSDGEVHVRDLRTGADRVLTQRRDFNAGLSAIAKDGSRVAYQAFEGGCDANIHGPAALCVVPLSANEAFQSKTLLQRQDVVEIAPMDWSIDGRTIAVSIRRQDRTAQIGLVSASDGSLRVLQTVDWRGPTRIVFSPDGQDLAFDLPVSDANDDRHIVTVAVDGSRGTTAVEHASQNVVMGWAPDGSALLFASNRGESMGLWAQPFSHRNPQGAPRLIRPAINGAWSSGVTRDGALYFGVSNSDLDISVARVDLESGRQQGPATRLLHRFVGTNSQPEWTPDGRFFAWVSQRGFNITNNVGRIIGVRDTSNGEEWEVRPKLLYFHSLSWSPSADALVTSGIDVKGREGVFKVDARTGDVSLIVEDTRNAYPRWSPDGRSIFYRKATRHQQDTDFTLVERALASGAERTITRGELGVFSVAPDGRFIAAPVGGILGSAARAIVEIRVDTGEQRDLLRAGPSERIPPYVAPRWTRDGKALLVRKRTPNEIWLVPTSGPQPRKLEIDVHDWAFGPIGQFSIHPDGQSIAFLSGTRTNEVMVLENFLPSLRSSR
jgi:Tol biopolymer transport system component